MILINIDRFRNINSLHGHDYGDRLLKEVGHGLVRQLPTDWLTARVDPDEFAVLPDSQSDLAKAQASDDEIEWIQKVQRVLREVFASDGHFRHITTSIGIAYSDIRSADAKVVWPGELMRMAEQAMRSAKNLGGGRIGFFDADSSKRAQESLQLEHDLGKALARNEFHLALQAQVTGDGQAVGAEALLRWRQSERGPISPGVFIPLAEDSGLINEIGHWVLQEALAILARMQKRSPKLTVSVNISPVQMRRQGFVDDVRDIIEQSGADPSGLILEITESVFMDSPQLASERLQSLRDLRVQISIDDFGTGYSSLTYLKRLPVNELKIDQSFVADLPDDAADVALVNIILSAADQLKLHVVAERVETASQAELFAKAPDTLLQGYYFDRPAPPEEWLDQWLPKTSH